MPSKHKSAIKRITASIQRLADNDQIESVDRLSALNEIRHNLDQIEDDLELDIDEDDYRDDDCDDAHDEDVEYDRRDFARRR